jgi:two-component sensor histidine kinase
MRGEAGQDGSPADASWIVGGGEMGELIRAFDWSKTAIGPIKDWSPTLRIMTRILLANRFPLLLWWGPDYVSIYNDAYRPVLGAKHPWALGKPVSECWSEIWHILKPLIDTPFNGGPATWNEDIELEINRHGFLEETHFTIAYSAVPDDDAPNGVGGVLATVTETTEKVVGERRVVLLRDLAARMGEARTPDEACLIAAATFSRHAKDIPFALLYLVDDDRKLARLAGATGVSQGAMLAPERIDLREQDDGRGWHLTAGSEPVFVDDLAARFPSASGETAGSAAVLPLGGLDPSDAVGFLIVGLNPRLKLDDRHHGFLQLIKNQVASAINRVHATETLRASEERFRAFVTASSDSVFRMNADWSEMRQLDGKNFIADMRDASKGWLAKYIHPDDQAGVRDAVEDAIRNKATFDHEHRVIRVDGSPGWTHSRAIPILGAEGEITEWFGAAQDVTGRKHAEEMQQLLVNELNHRVKNMLASVHAIAQQTLRRAKDPAAFAESFSGRLQSLSRIHTLLTSTGWEGADLHDIIREQVLPGAVDDKRVIATGPAVRLESQTAMHTAMMLHELGTNSAKHGALSKPDGSVAIAWTVTDDVLRLDWREQGGPPVKVPLGRGFGTTLIEQTVKGEGGSAHRSVEAAGIRWQIDLPLAGAEDAPNASQERKDAVQRDRDAGPAEIASIRGKRFAIIEDEPLIALEITCILEREGAQVLGPAVTVKEALNLIERNQFDAALIDGNLRGRRVGDIAAALTRKKVPFAFVTGYGQEALPRSFAQATTVRKPFTERQLLEAATAILGARPKTVLRLRD